MPFPLEFKINLRTVLALWCWFLLALVLTAGSSATGQDQENSAPVKNSTNASDDAAGEIPVPERVEVAPTAEDEEIELRLTRILEATGWYRELKVEVDEGIVFLEGWVTREENRTWAGDLARRTQDVVAVVNRIRMEAQPVWDFRPAWNEIERLVRDTLQFFPIVAVGMVIVVLAWFASALTAKIARVAFNRRLGNALLADVATRITALFALIIGVYLALRISGLTQIAATVLGGTGLFGLVIGIAFRDIAENFLASVLISVQRPFALGDQIEVNNHTGMVQSVTMRGTLLMTPEGNHVQIPNSIVYKSTIRNLTSNPNVRLQFDIGIGYDDSINQAQTIILDELRQHEAVLLDPEPMVLVETLSVSSVSLRVYFWIDGIKHSRLKVRSSIIRLAKRAIQNNGISIPDEGREIVVSKAIPIRLIRDHSPMEQTQREATANGALPLPPKDLPAEPIANPAEGSFESDVAIMEEQAKKARNPELGTNLLAIAEQEPEKPESEEENSQGEEGGEQDPSVDEDRKLNASPKSEN